MFYIIMDDSSLVHYVQWNLIKARLSLCCNKGHHCRLYSKTAVLIFTVRVVCTLWCEGKVKLCTSFFSPLHVKYSLLRITLPSFRGTVLKLILLQPGKLKD